LNKKVVDETLNLLRELIQNKCVNPPGNEMNSAQTIKQFLENKGISCDVFESSPNRGNIIAKIKGSDEKHPGLIFGPSHIDVVPITKPESWSVDPFAGEIKDNFIWGRGTLDMLFIVATQVQAFAQLVKENFKPKGDLILFIVSDEECGGTYGAKWMIENHSDLLEYTKKKMFAVTEFGGVSIAPNKFVFVNGEKGASWKELVFKGSPSHGSMPFASDNAVLKASKAALLLSKYCDKHIPISTNYLKNLVDGLGLNFLMKLLLTKKIFLPLTLKLLRKREPQLSKFIHSLSRMTISPNIIKGGDKTNIIASTASLYLDIRTLPEQDEEYVEFHIKKALGKLAQEVEIKPVSTEGIVSRGTESPANTEFVKAMEEAIKKEFPEAKLVPLIAMGATDGRMLREKNVDAYGFALFDPTVPMNEFINLAHGVDERVSIKTIELSLKAYYNLAKIFLS